MADRQHGIPNAVVRPTNELYEVNGRLTRGIDMTVPPEVFEQYREGYRCIACHHFPQPEPFPEHCIEPYCRFPMRTEQSRQLEFEYRGDVDLWPTRAAESGIDMHDNSLWLPGQPLD